MAKEATPQEKRVYRARIADCLGAVLMDISAYTNR